MVGLGVCATANATTESLETESSEIDSSEIERIEVIGELTLSGYKQQIIAAKKDFFSLYNDLTKNGALKVKCRTERKLGSNVRTDVCTPVYESLVHVPRSSIADFFRGELDTIIDKKLKKYQDKQIDELTVLVNSNEELRAKFFEYSTALEKYQAKRASQKLASNE